MRFFFPSLAATGAACWALSLLVLASSSTSNQPVDLGTTLVAVKFDRGVVLGADTRTSQGGVMVSHRYAHKIVPITATTLIARSGSAADTQQLADQARLQNEVRRMQYGSQLTVSQTAHWLRKKVYGGNGDGGVVSLIVAGFDNKPRIYTVSPSGALLEDPGVFAVSGSGSTFILGHLDHQLADCGQLDEEGAVELCRQAIELAIHRDGSSGGLIRLYIITAEGRREVTVFPDADDTKNSKGPEVPSLPGFAPAEALPKSKRNFDLSRR